jgi:hypothetical protein
LPSKNLLLDDRLLLAHLLGSASRPLADLLKRRSVSTTGLWYYRLCHAVRSGNVTGALSGPFAAAEPRIKARAATAMVRLPENVGLMSLLELAPVMADLIERHRLNILSLEALAAAISLDSDIAIAIGSENPTLMQAAEHEGVRVHLVSV